MPQKQPLWTSDAYAENEPDIPGSAPKDPAQARLINVSTGQSFLLANGKERFTIGRDTTNDIVVNDINASRTHAELKLEPQGFWSITDLQSTNGTFVNASEISACSLEDGDSITIGLTNYVFRLA